jgi:S1-C subfamily serine protease
MKKFTLWFLLACMFLASLGVRAGRAWPGNEQAVPVLITAQDEKTNDLGWGSGFFLMESNRVYLVTARHVLFDPANSSLRSPRAKLTYYPHWATNTTNIEMVISLSALNGIGFIKTSTNADIAAIHLADQMKNGDWQFIGQVSTKNSELGLQTVDASMLRGFADIEIGSPLFTFGYPESIGLRNIPQIDYDRPLLHSGVVSQKNLSKKTIIIDCPIFPGNSGGPVVVIDTPQFGKPQFYVIGVAIEFVPYFEVFQNKLVSSQNSGYSVVEPIDKVLPLVRQ